MTYGLVHVAIVVFRRADPEEYDPAFEMPSPLYPVVSVLDVVITGVVISQMELPIILVGTGTVFLGVVWYVIYARSRGAEEGLFNEAFGSLIQDVTTRLPGTGPTVLSGDTAGRKPFKNFATPGWRISFQSYVRRYQQADVLTNRLCEVLKLFDQIDTDVDWSGLTGSSATDLTATQRSDGSSGAPPTINQTSDQPRVAELAILQSAYAALHETDATIDKIQSHAVSPAETAMHT